jgi:hypothetical protein
LRTSFRCVHAIWARKWDDIVDGGVDDTCADRRLPVADGDFDLRRNSL